jgi:electron transfer flavoprotein beta subunit
VRFAVCVKNAVDETELKIDQGGRPVLGGAASRMSAFDKNAVEEALRLRSLHGGEVVAFTVGTAEAKKTLKEALAMGVDRGVLVVADQGKIDTLQTAGLLSAAITGEGRFDAVLCSEGSSDTYTGLVPAALAEILELAYVGYSRKVEILGETAVLERSLEDSVEKVEALLPFVASVVSEINEPRYPTLIQIMQASKKPITEVAAGQLALEATRSSPVIMGMSAQPSNRKHVVLDGTPEEAAAKLIEALEKEGVLSR